MRFSRAVLAAILTTSCAIVGAQNVPKAPQSVPPPVPNMQPQMDQLSGMFEKMNDAMLAAQLKAARKPEVAEGIAQYKRNLYDALVKQGFRPDEALQIVIATPLPGAAATASR